MKRRVVCAVALAISASVSQASAYCRTRTCQNNLELCEYDGNGCMLSGKVLSRSSSCVSFNVQRDGSKRRGISYDAAHASIAAAFERWLGADCGNGLNPQLELADLGAAVCHTAEYNQDSPNANVIIFRDSDWPYQNDIDTYALTTVKFDTVTGEIYDADVEVNTFESAMKIGNIGPKDIDFESIITHEIGHFLGLSHSEEEGATMGGYYALGDTSQASIEPDDVAGVCAALAPDRMTTSASCEPRHGFSADCGDTAASDEPPSPHGGCQYTPSRPSPLQGMLCALLALGAIRLRRRRVAGSSN